MPARFCKADDCARYRQGGTGGYCDTHGNEKKHGPLPALDVLARHARRKPSGWAARAACAGTPVPLGAFFPEHDGKVNVPDDVVALCRDCPVRAECIADTFHYPADENFGYRAGTMGADREALRGALVDLGMADPREGEDEDLEDPAGLFVVDGREPSAEDVYLETLEPLDLAAAETLDALLDAMESEEVPA